MSSTITLKRQITSIKGTRQITKAMELVSASKLRRAQAYALKSREYSGLAYHLLQKLNAIQEVERQPLFRVRQVKTRLYIVVTSNTGLAGAYNANVLKRLIEAVKVDEAAKVTSSVITIGSKGAQIARRVSEIDLLAVYPTFGEQPGANDIRPILDTVVNQFKEEAVDEVYIIYTKFISTINQTVQSQKLLPAPCADNVVAGEVVSNFEPDVETVVDQITTRLIEAQIWQDILESKASEHAMRMIATKNATDNANDLIDDYTLELNTARQASITQELAEISGGAEAIGL